MNKFILSVILLIVVNAAKAQLTVDNSMTPTQLVQNILLGSGVTATNITYTGDVLARGYFNGTASNIGLASGVILSTGVIDSAIGPNDDPGMGTDFQTSSSDPDLGPIAGAAIYDKAILEFDFVPDSDSIKFRYVFGSEEYMEFVNSGFNDAFGFFITGPNPFGAAYASENIAIIPGTTTPVTIDNVNMFSNGQYYFNNGNGYGYGNTDSIVVQYDGFTVPLTASAAVVCGQTYHIKMAIADAGDGAYDSGVFLEEGSFSSIGVEILPEISYGGANDSTLYEGCGNACIYFVRTSNSLKQDTIDVIIEGSAVNGVDYNTGVSGVPLPTQLIFTAGQDTILYCINAVADGITEGPDTIKLTIISESSCAQVITHGTVYLNEYSPLIASGNDTTFCNQGGTLTLSATVTGGVEPYSYSWFSGTTPLPSTTVTVNSTTPYIVTVGDACVGNPDPTPPVTDTTTVFVQTFDALSVNAGNDMTVCPEDILGLQAIVTGGGPPYIYSWITISGSDTVISNNTVYTTIIPTTEGIYQITVTDICNNTQSDDIAIDVEGSCTLNIPNIITPDGEGPPTNEIFYIDHLDNFPASSLVIYNRWGIKIYENSNYQNDWNGSTYADGTYYYVLNVPISGTVLAKPDDKPYDINIQSEENATIFAGYFQIIRN